MATDNGEHILDDLILLGYTIDVSDDGRITATNDVHTVHGKAEHGAIAWSDRSVIFHIAEQAYIARLRKRVASGQA
jgi:hypothetical protein